MFSPRLLRLMIIPPQFGVLKLGSDISSMPGVIVVIWCSDIVGRSSRIHPTGKCRNYGGLY